MRIWRVAHAYLTYDEFPSGPYVEDGLSFEIFEEVSEYMNDSHGGSSRHPIPQNDPDLDDVNPWERCGFGSLEALYSWFDGFTKLLAEHEFLIYVYEVPDDFCRVGKVGQAVFDADSAKQVEVMAFDERMASVFVGS